MYIERVAVILPVHTGCKDPFELKKKKSSSARKQSLQKPPKKGMLHKRGWWIIVIFSPHFSGVLPINVPLSEFQTKRPKSSHLCPQVLFSFKAAMMKFCADQDPQQTFYFLTFPYLLPSLTQRTNCCICFSSLLSLPKDFKALMSGTLYHFLLQVKLKVPGPRSRVWCMCYLIFTIYKAKIRWACCRKGSWGGP